MSTTTSFMDMIGEEYFKEDATLNDLTQNLKKMDINFAKDNTTWTRNHSNTYRKIKKKINKLSKATTDQDNP